VNSPEDGPVGPKHVEIHRCMNKIKTVTSVGFPFLMLFIQLFCFWSELFRHDGNQETTYTCEESALISARYWKYVECKTEITYPLAGIFLEAKDFRQRRASSYGRTTEAEMTRRASVFSFGGSLTSFL